MQQEINQKQKNTKNSRTAYTLKKPEDEILLRKIKRNTQMSN